jgi:hypothetical protein
MTLKGKTNNPNGRPKGSINKRSAELKLWVSRFLAKNKKLVQADFEKLESKDRLMFFEKLLKYSIPAMQNTSVNFEQMTDEQLDHVIDELLNRQTPPS